MGRYDDNTDEEMMIFLSNGRRDQGWGFTKSVGGRRGGRTSSRNIRTRLSIDDDAELLASEQQTNAWLAVSIIGLLAVVGFLSYDRFGFNGTFGPLGHKNLPLPEASAKDKGGGGKNIMSGVHGNPGEDDDWYDDKFQREVPTKQVSSRANHNHAAKSSRPMAVAGSTGKESKPDVKELIKMVYNRDDSEEDGENEDDDKFQKLVGGEKDWMAENEDWNELNSEEVVAEVMAVKVKAENPAQAKSTYNKESNLSAKDYQEQLAKVERTEGILAQLAPYATWNVPYREESNLPVFWHIPMSAGTTFEDILSHCYGLIEANEIGIFGGHENDKELFIIKTEDGGQYVNVDTTTQKGIAHAKSLGLALSGLADVIMTPFIHDAASLFHDTKVKGKCHTFIRHPIHRAVAMFYFLHSNASQDSPFNNMTIEEYATGPYCEENWMVRFLTNEMTGTLQWHHLDLAKEILGRKCLIGLVNKFEESLKRFELYFGWDKLVEEEDKNQCEEHLIAHGDNVHLHPKYKEGSDVWEMLKKKNGYDLMLYEYAEEIFEKQTLYTETLNY